MAKLSVVNRNKKREKLVQRKASKRAALKEAARKVYSDETASIEDRMNAHAALQRLSRNSSKTRVRKRCSETGRPRGNNFTGVSRIYLRRIICEGLVPGVTKSSW